MLKALVGFVVGVLVIAIGGFLMMPSLMFNEMQSPFGFEETIARILAAEAEPGEIISHVELKQQRGL